MNTIELENNNDDLLFKNIMIIDNLFKASGKIYDVCLNLYQENVEDANYIRASLYGFDIVIEATEGFSFAFFNSNFRFIFEEDTILFMYDSIAVRLEQPCNDQDVEDFKKTFLFVINLRSGSYYETIDQFIDLYNMIRI